MSALAAPRDAALVLHQSFGRSPRSCRLRQELWGHFKVETACASDGSRDQQRPYEQKMTTAHADGRAGGV